LERISTERVEVRRQCRVFREKEIGLVLCKAYSGIERRQRATVPAVAWWGRRVRHGTVGKDRPIDARTAIGARAAVGFDGHGSIAPDGYGRGAEESREEGMET
jgi:hypothetical protein